jgi:photosystem II stability/assembly factor-like uncharacterized protein
VASSSDGSRLAAVVYGNPGNIFTSNDSGATWIQRAPDLNKYWQGIAMSGDGTKLVASSYMRTVYTSKDSGATWTSGEAVRDAYGVAASADGGIFVAAAPGYIYTTAPLPKSSQNPIPKGSVKAIKVSTKKYTLTISSNAPNTKYTITATKKGAKTLTFSGTTKANGSAIRTIAQNLFGYKFMLKLGAK